MSSWMLSSFISHQECCFSFDSSFRFTLSFLHLVQLSSPWAGCGFLSDIFAPDDPYLLPRVPRPPCKQLPAQLSEMLLVACSLIKNLQRPLTAYTAKSQPVCLSFKSLHYPLPRCPFHFISHSFPKWSHFYDWSPHWLGYASCSSCLHAVRKLCPRPK